MKQTLTNLILIFSLFVIPLGAQETTAPPQMDFGLSIGTVTLDESVYNSIRFLPELAVGKFGLGLDLDYRFTMENDNEGDTRFQVYEEDWYIPEDPSFQKYLNLYLSKFAYIRWGEQQDPLYIRFGSLGSTTLGTGFTMGGYTNTLFLPAERIFGGQLKVDGKLFDFPYAGVQGMVSNVSALDLLGARFYGRPASMTEIPLVKTMEVGFSFYTDRDPYLYLTDEDGNGFYDIYENAYLPADTDADSVVVTGLDLIVPVFLKEYSSLALMGDLVFQGQNDPHTGGMIGAGGSVLFFRYTAQLRFMGDDFQPVYFDQTYDFSRAEKYQIYANKGDPLIKGGPGYLMTLGTSFFQDGLLFNLSVDGPLSETNGDSYDYPHLKGLFTLQPGVVEMVDFSFWYDKTEIDSFSALFSPEQAIIGGVVNIHIAPAIISFQMDAKYDPANQEEWTVTSQISTGIQF